MLPNREMQDEPLLSHRDWWGLIGGICAVGIPPAVLIALICRFYVGVPRQEQWFFLQTYEYWVKGKLSLGIVWGQVSEHWHFFSRLLLLGMARLSHWDLRWEVAGSLVCAAGIFGNVWAIARRELRGLGMSGIHAAVLMLISMGAFSLTQYETWLWTWQFTIVFTVFLVMSALNLLHASRDSLWFFIAGIVVGIIASFCCTNGVLLWPVGGLMLAGLWYRSGQVGLRLRLGLLVAVAAAIALIYVHSFKAPPPYYPAPKTSRSAADVAAFFAAYLGAPLAPTSPWSAAVIGAGGIALWGGAALMLARTGPIHLSRISGILAIGLFAVLSSAITAAWRSNFGAGQALAPRYVSYSIHLWFSIILLCYALHGVTRARISRLQPVAGSIVARYGFALVLAAIFALQVRASVQSVDGFRYYHERFLPAQQELLKQNPRDEMLKRLFPNTAYVRSLIPVMKEYRLAVFRD